MNREIMSTIHAEWTVPRLRVLALERFPDEFRKSLRTRPQILAFLLTHDVDLSKPPVASAASVPVEAGGGFIAPAQNLQNLRVPELKRLASACPGYKSTMKKNELLQLLHAHPEVLTHRSEPPRPESFHDLEIAVKKREVSAAALKEIAAAHGWKKEIHGRGKTTDYLLFLKDRYGILSPEHPAVEAASTPIIDSLEDLRSKTWSRVVLLENARKKGWPYKTKGSIKELVEFLTSKFPVCEGGGVEESKEDRTPAPPTPQWPLENIDAMTGLSKKEIKDILRKYNISEALPDNKKDLLHLFSKKRCGKTDLRACDRNEVCDLRNELCRDDMSGKSTKLVQYIFQGRRFWGSPEILQDIRQAVVDLERNAAGADAGADAEGGTEGGGCAATTRWVEPVRVSNLMENKEEYLRSMCRAIEATFHLGRDAVHVDRPFQPRFQLFQDSNEELI